MKIGVLGTGAVGQALATGLPDLGHEVKIGSRDPQQAKVRAWVAQGGAHASAGTYAETAHFGELLIFAVLGTAAEEVIQQAVPHNFAGKVVIDTTNPFANAPGAPTLFVGHTDSLGERIQRAIPDGQVVKAFNIVGAALMVHPQLPGGPPDMFICGNEPRAKATVAEILHAFGWASTIDIGGIDGARYLEPMAMVWVRAHAGTHTWIQAFKLLRA
ncbi:MAG TPA: NAD(P)-binding domain-containing protein [Armatimonadota bacterium]|jgi:hypothetical protein